MSAMKPRMSTVTPRSRDTLIQQVAESDKSEPEMHQAQAAAEIVQLLCALCLVQLMLQRPGTLKIVDGEDQTNEPRRGGNGHKR